jgi:hypothetical protein
MERAKTTPVILTERSDRRIFFAEVDPRRQDPSLRSG